MTLREVLVRLASAQNTLLEMTQELPHSGNGLLLDDIEAAIRAIHRVGRVLDERHAAQGDKEIKDS